MAPESTLTSPLGTPVYTPRDEDQGDLFVTPSRAGRLAPLVVGGIGAVIIIGGAILYGFGIIGAPVLYPTVAGPAAEPRWEPNPEFSKALGVQALQNLERVERVDTTAARQRNGSLLPAEQRPAKPGLTVSPPSPGERTNDRELWEPPVEPKPAPRNEVVPKAADPKRTVPNGYAK
jgi:hypothetical protein